ncbi:hypothetical protein HDU67_000404 [Dinochytrium kinnereticum]|nr:hypothetical protein HDU67_000404 [Dinochytrium kinnereticum]
MPTARSATLGGDVSALKREDTQAPEFSTIHRSTKDIELRKAPTVRRNLTSTGKPKGPRRLLEASIKDVSEVAPTVSSEYTFSTSPYKTTKGPYTTLACRQRATQQIHSCGMNESGWATSRAPSVSSFNSLATSPIPSPSPQYLHPSAAHLLTQAGPVTRLVTTAHLLNVTSSAASEMTASTHLETSSTAAEISSTFGSEDIRNGPPIIGRKGSVRWADIHGDVALTSSSATKMSEPSLQASLSSETLVRRSSLAEFLTKHEMAGKVEHLDQSRAPLRWREAHPEPVTPKLGPQKGDPFEIHDQLTTDETTLNSNTFTLDRATTLNLPRETREEFKSTSSFHQTPLVQPIYPIYDQIESEPPITVLTVSSGETRTIEAKTDPKYPLPPPRLPDFYRQTPIRQTLPIHRTWVFRLLLLQIILHGTAALLSVAAYNDYIKPSKGVTDETEAGLPVDPFKGIIDTRWQNTMTAIQTAGVGYATGFAVLICATMRSRTGRPAKSCRIMGIATSWCYAVVMVVISVMVFVGQGDDKDLRGQACERRNGGGVEKTFGVNFESVCIKATTSGVVGVATGCVWFLVGLIEVLTMEGRDAVNK